MKKIFCLFLLLLSPFIAAYGLASKDPIAVDQAFTLSAKTFGQDTVVFNWKIRPDYYLYKDRLHFKIIAPANSAIGQVILPTGKSKEDEIFGKYEIYSEEANIAVPIISPNLENTQLSVNYQGCSEYGYCYPPTQRYFKINFAQGTVDTLNPPDPQAQKPSTPAQNSQIQPFLNILTGNHTVSMLLAFFGFGVLLSFTPCVLPMLPILSGLIVGYQKNTLKSKALKLSIVYVLSMAATYAIAGVLVGWLGGSIQSTFQKPWVIIVFSFLFVLLALSFFGLYSIKLPACLEEKIASISRHQKSGHYLGVAVMGCLATLIVSPCVTPALVGILGYISQTGNAFIGGLALFAMGLGMGTPLILLGLVGDKLLPKAGAWMQTVEYVFGILFLALAIEMLSRLVPASITLALLAGLLIICSVYLGVFSTAIQGWQKLWKGIGLIALTYGILLMIGAAQGNGNPLQPLSPNHASSPVSNNDSIFTPVKSLADVKTALADAAKQHKPVLVDFYADWCISCQEMQATTFTDSVVLQTLKQMVVLKADVTQNDETDKQLMQYFQVIAPPTFVLFNEQGQWLKDQTHAGKMDSAEFLGYIANLGKSLS